MSIAAIQPIDIVAPQLVGRLSAAHAPTGTSAATSFAEMLTHGIAATNAKVAEADRLVAQAAVDSSVPLHQVTYALEQARLSFELMIQLRNRLIETSQQLMNMQL